MFLWAFLVAQTVKNLAATQEAQVQFLDQEEPLEKWMATRSSILVWEIPRTEEPSETHSKGSQRVRYDWATNTSLLFHFWLQGNLWCVCGCTVLPSIPILLRDFSDGLDEARSGPTDGVYGLMSNLWEDRLTTQTFLQGPGTNRRPCRR